MARVKRVVLLRARHKKILKQAKSTTVRVLAYTALFQAVIKLVSMLTVTVVNVSVSSVSQRIAYQRSSTSERYFFQQIHQCGLKKPLVEESTVRSWLISQYSTSGVHRSG